MRYMRSLAWLAAIGALIGGLWFWRSGHAKTQNPAAVAPPPAAYAPEVVTTLTLRPESLEIVATATGSLLGRESVALVSELSRRLVRVRAEEGSAVKQGAVLFELDAQDLRAENAKLDVDAQLAKVTLDRAERLQQEGLANQEELDLARARVAQLVAQRAALQVTLSKTQIRAPFAGTLGLRRVSEGAWLTPTTVLTTLQDTTQLKVDFTLPERYSAAVVVGEEFRFRVDGHAEQFRGKIVAIEPTVDASTRSLSVRGLVAEGHHLIPGSAVNVELPLRIDQALLVPAIALQSGVDGRRVFVVDQNKARSVAVEIGFRSADRVQLISGVKAGDQVAVGNLLRLRNGTPVTVQAEAKP